VSRGSLWLQGRAGTCPRRTSRITEAEAGSLFERRPHSGQWRSLHPGAARPMGNDMLPRYPGRRTARRMTTTRRLAAILAADVAGYSRLIGADEGAPSNA